MKEPLFGGLFGGLLSNLKSDCLKGPRENPKMWHMVKKLKTFSRPEIPDSATRNMIRFFFIPDLRYILSLKGDHYN